MPLCDSMDYSPSGSSVHGILQAIILVGNNTGVGSHSLLQRIFPTQGLNLGLLYCRWILYHLSHQRNPGWMWRVINWWGFPGGIASWTQFPSPKWGLPPQDNVTSAEETRGTDFFVCHFTSTRTPRRYIKWHFPWLGEFLLAPRLTEKSQRRPILFWGVVFQTHWGLTNSQKFINKSSSVCVVAQLCLTLFDAMDCSPSGSPVHGIHQASIE